HHVVEAAGRERHDQANRSDGVALRACAGVGRHCDECDQQRRNRSDAFCAERHHAASFSISPITASPICAVPTSLQPSDLMSAVRRPCASAAAIARSIRSASLPMLKEYRSAMAKEASMAIGLAMPLPAISGAEPCTGSYSALRFFVFASTSPSEADGSMPSEP